MLSSLRGNTARMSTFAILFNIVLELLDSEIIIIRRRRIASRWERKKLLFINKITLYVGNLKELYKTINKQAWHDHRIHEYIYT